MTSPVLGQVSSTLLDGLVDRLDTSQQALVLFQDLDRSDVGLEWRQNRHFGLGVSLGVRNRSRLGEKGIQCPSSGLEILVRNEACQVRIETLDADRDRMFSDPLEAGLQLLQTALDGLTRVR